MITKNKFIPSKYVLVKEKNILGTFNHTDMTKSEEFEGVIISGTKYAVSFFEADKKLGNDEELYVRVKMEDNNGNARIYNVKPLNEKDAELVEVSANEVLSDLLTISTIAPDGTFKKTPSELLKQAKEIK